MKFKPLILKNTIQKYAWGSHTAIQSLLGESSSQEPWAELWMGAHPKAPSEVNFNDTWIPLNSLIGQYPIEILGAPIAKNFNNTLPLLFKVLAAEHPLSIQAHPNKIQAINGFARENKMNIPLNAPHRNYKDDQHKPEIICALTPFTGLKGFRKIASTIEMLKMLCPINLKNEIDTLKNKGLKLFFKSLMELPGDDKIQVINESVKNAEKLADQNDSFKWLIRLYQMYPQDIGILSPVILNLICLEPGQALFLPAGELHAYLDGLGIELMANSDNVLRGGLTPKHVDVTELLDVLTFNETKVEILLPETIASGEGQYPVLAEEFSLSVISLDSGVSYASPQNRSIEILLCVNGKADIMYDDGKPTVQIQKGVSVLVPASIDQYQITGKAELFKAGVPIS